MIVTMTSRPRRLARQKGYDMATKSTKRTRARATLAKHAAHHATARKAARKRNAARGVRLHNDNAGARLMDAALALADTRPVMPRELALVDSVLRHGFCGSGPLARDFEVTGEIASVTIHAESRTAGKPGHYVMRADCAQGGVR